jgi:hypothetical protein
MQTKNIKSMCRAGFIVIWVAFFICLGLKGEEIYAAQQSKPLLIPGKRTLYQKVITHPGTKLYALAGNSEKVLEKWVKPFTVFYVYQRASVGGEPWLEVGLSNTEGAVGWIKGSKTSDWNQALTLIFSERTGRQPALFLKDLKSLQKVAGSPSPGEQAAQLVTQFAAIQSRSISPPAQFPVLAVEPPEEAVSRKRFYLIPIFQALELFEGVKFLEVASVDPGSGRLPEDIELKTAIVFVIDTTISMKPYIERTRKAVSKIYDAIEKAGLSDKVAFGLVAFRNSTRKTPGVEYVVRVLSDLRTVFIAACLSHYRCRRYSQRRSLFLNQYERSRDSRYGRGRGCQDFCPSSQNTCGQKGKQSPLCGSSIQDPDRTFRSDDRGSVCTH